jgi:hypothetical protein
VQHLILVIFEFRHKGAPHTWVSLNNIRLEPASEEQRAGLLREVA